jgi:hypothetical protein
MGEVLCFEPRRTGRAPGDRVSSADAIVIIFPGVRYERLTRTDLLANSRAKAQKSDKSKLRPSRH